MKIFIFLLMLLTQTAGLAQTSLKLAVIADSSVSEVGSKILIEILKKTDIIISPEKRPAARASLEARAGLLDGEVTRNANYADAFPELIRVDPPYYALQTSAFVKSGSPIHITKPQDLLPYKLGMVRGIKTSEQLVRGAVSITEVNHNDQLMQMLNLARFDVAITSSLNGKIAIKKLGISNIDEAVVLDTRDMHLYLHVKHRALVPAISLSIQKLKKSGELAKIIHAVELQALNHPAELK
jgi:polar amino acid transport system substrate-binding protein